MQYLRQITIFLCLLFVSPSCLFENEHEYYIEWDKSTLICIADEGGYPRMRRLKDKSLITVYENRRGDVMLKRSFNEGATWSDPQMVYEGFFFTDEKTGKTTKVNIANPEIIQLDNDNLLIAFNLRPRSGGIYPFSIAIKKSNDNGATWTKPEILFKAGTYFKDGCWEPSFLQLPDGMLHLYFANESPYREIGDMSVYKSDIDNSTSSDQEISLLYSADNGFTWSDTPITVSYRKGKRDGMPVAVHDNNKIYVAIEDNLSQQFKPYLVQSPIEQAWKNPILSDSPYRYPALKIPLADTVYAGAPYLIRTDKGQYVLSYQTTENRTSNWEFSTMEVVVSEGPLNFDNPTQPFDVPLMKEAKWNSLTDMGNNTVAALATTNFCSDKIGVWMIKGKIVKR